MFGPAPPSSRPGDASLLEQGDSVAKPPTEPSAGIYSHAGSGTHRDSDDSPRPEELMVRSTLSSSESLYIIQGFQLPKATCVFCSLRVQQRVNNGRFSRNKTRLQCLDQQEGRCSQVDPARDKIRQRVRQMLCDSPTEDNRALISKGKRRFQPESEFYFRCFRFFFLYVVRRHKTIQCLIWGRGLLCVLNFFWRLEMIYFCCRCASQRQHNGFKIRPSP